MAGRHYYHEIPKRVVHKIYAWYEFEDAERGVGHVIEPLWWFFGIDTHIKELSFKL